MRTRVICRAESVCTGPSSLVYNYTPLSGLQQLPKSLGIDVTHGDDHHVCFIHVGGERLLERVACSVRVWMSVRCKRVHTHQLGATRGVSACRTAPWIHQYGGAVVGPEPAEFSPSRWCRCQQQRECGWKASQRAMPQTCPTRAVLDASRPDSGVVPAETVPFRLSTSHYPFIRAYKPIHL